MLINTTLQKFLVKALYYNDLPTQFTNALFIQHKKAR